jgi:colanic acid/amylovoran biosynthesis glycosyltransferase
MHKRTTSNRKKRFVNIPTLKITVLPNGKLVLTKKFITGMQEHLRYWGGPGCVIAEPSSRFDNNLDHVEVSAHDTRAELGFDVHIVNFNPVDMRKHLMDDDVLLAGLAPPLAFLPSLRRLGNLHIVYVSEYSLKTRLQIAAVEGRNQVRMFARSLKDLHRENVMRTAVKQSDGIQCNGRPTYDAYQGISPDPLLFFDSRLSSDMLATEHEVLSRGAEGPIRLVFSGRLIAMKGVDHLVETSKHLATLGVDFELAIYGEGALVPEIKEAIAAHGLAGRVKLGGMLDFDTELVPLVKKRADLFVCCHRQGDPSCTYLETMSCGVPIVGYDNEAFRGVVRDSHSGWLSPMNRPAELAAKIAQLSRNRDEVVDHSLAALRFARRHCFEQTFQQRNDHLQRIASTRWAKAS